MPSKCLLQRLLLAALLLPAAVLVVGAFGRLLSALGDRAGGVFFERIAMVGGLLWVLGLFGLLLATAARTLDDRGPSDRVTGDSAEKPDGKSDE